jgi:hypothetical protein
MNSERDRWILPKASEHNGCCLPEVMTHDGDGHIRGRRRAVPYEGLLLFHRKTVCAANIREWHGAALVPSSLAVRKAGTHSAYSTLHFDPLRTILRLGHVADGAIDPIGSQFHKQVPRQRSTC